MVDVEPEASILLHTNHFVKPHSPQVRGSMHLPDSPFRFKRISDLVRMALGKSSEESIMEMLKDEQDYPVSICRAQTEDSTVATLFGIVMDLQSKIATVTMGRPVEGGKKLLLDPGKNM